jgi:hypothetical protein
MRSRALISVLADRGAALPASPVQLAAIFAATVFLRNLLECLSEGMLFPESAFLLHFPIAYLYPMSGLTLLLSSLSGYPLAKLSRIMVYAWTLTILPPLIDFVSGTTSAIGYFPLERSNAVHFFLNFFNPMVELPGTTTGIRVEAALGCVLAGIFSWGVAADGRRVRGVLTTMVMAPVFLVFFTWPNLVHGLLGNLFPDTSTAQEFYQWHAATSPHLSGEFHNTIFLVDLIPVLGILAVFLKRLDPGAWTGLARGASREYWTLLAPAAGAICAASSAGWLLTFADTLSISGAFTASVLVALSFHTGNRTGLRMMLMAGAVTTAIAVGWLTTVLILLSAAVSMLPGARRPATTLTSALLTLTAFSPVGLSFSPALAATLLLSALAGASGTVRLAGGASGLMALAAALVLTTSPPTACLDFHRSLIDSFNRNGRLDMALPVSMTAAGCGGDMLTLARAELATGSMDKARWAYGLALADGDSSADAVRTGFNLAYLQGRSGELDSLLASGAGSLDERGDAELAGLLLENAVDDGDTVLIGMLMENYGADPLLLSSYSMACAAMEDHPRAAMFARAAASHPRAEAGQIAWAVHVTAMENGPYDSLYAIGIGRFPGSVDLMTARLMAPLVAGRDPDREDLLDACLRLRPYSPSVLRTAAAWRLENGQPAGALEMAERAIAVDRLPDLDLLNLACAAALASGDMERLLVHAGYGLTLYPDSREMAAYRRIGSGDGQTRIGDAE